MDMRISLATQAGKKSAAYRSIVKAITALRGSVWSTEDAFLVLAKKALADARNAGLGETCLHTEENPFVCNEGLVCGQASNKCVTEEIGKVESQLMDIGNLFMDKTGTAAFQSIVEAVMALRESVWSTEAAFLVLAKKALADARNGGLSGISEDADAEAAEEWDTWENDLGSNERAMFDNLSKVIKSMFENLPKESVSEAYDKWLEGLSDDETKMVGAIWAKQNADSKMLEQKWEELLADDELEDLPVVGP